MKQAEKTMEAINASMEAMSEAIGRERFYLELMDSPLLSEQAKHEVTEAWINGAIEVTRELEGK